MHTHYPLLNFQNTPSPFVYVLGGSGYCGHSWPKTREAQMHEDLSTYGSRSQRSRVTKATCLTAPGAGDQE